MSKKYHMEHPTISFRCRNIEEYTKIKEMVTRSGKSESDYVREIVLGVVTKESQSFQAGCNQERNKCYFYCPNCNIVRLIDLNTDVEARQIFVDTFSTYQHQCVTLNQSGPTPLIRIPKPGGVWFPVSRGIPIY